MNDADVLKAVILKNSMFYGVQLPDIVFKMHADALSDLPLAKVEAAYEALAKTSKNRLMPMPGDVRNLISPEAGDRDSDEARMVAARVIGAIAKYGYINPERAREFIGETGWMAIELMGGWVSVCENTKTNQLTTFSAQARELIQAISKSGTALRKEDPKHEQVGFGDGQTKMIGDKNE